MGKSNGSTRSSASNNARGLRSGGGRITISKPDAFGTVWVSGKEVNDISAIGISDSYIGNIIRERYGDIQNGGGEHDGEKVYGFRGDDASPAMIKQYIKDWAEGARLLKAFYNTQSDEARRAYNNWVEEYRLKTRRMNHPEEFD